MALNYLVLADVKTKLIDYGVTTLVDMLPDSILIDTIEEIEDRIDSYLGYSAGIRQYKEEEITNDSGLIVLTHYPVVSIISCNAFLPTFTTGSATVVPTQMTEAISMWDHTNTLLLGFAGINCEIEYTAGTVDESLLTKIGRVAFTALRQALLGTFPGEVPTLDFLDEPTADETSLSLPGGLSHSLTLGQPAGGGAGSRGITGKGTAADRLFSSLSTYRRLYRF